MTDNVRHILEDSSGDRKYFVQTQQLVWALCRGPHDLALWTVVKMTAGEGMLILRTDELAKLAMMSPGKIVESRNWLLACGLLAGYKKQDPGHKQKCWHLRVPDIWRKNIIWRSQLDDLFGPHHIKAKLAWRIAWKEQLKGAGVLSGFKDQPPEKIPPLIEAALEDLTSRPPANNLTESDSLSESQSKVIHSVNHFPKSDSLSESIQEHDQEHTCMHAPGAGERGYTGTDMHDARVGVSREVVVNGRPRRETDAEYRAVTDLYRSRLGLASPATQEEVDEVFDIINPPAGETKVQWFEYALDQAQGQRPPAGWTFARAVLVGDKRPGIMQSGSLKKHKQLQAERSKTNGGTKRKTSTGRGGGQQGEESSQAILRRRAAGLTKQQRKELGLDDA